MIKKTKNARDDEFLLAVRNGEIQTARSLLDSGADIETTDGHIFNRRALHFACMRTDISMVTMLLDRGADVNGADDDGDGPLYYAAVNDRTEVIELLLQRGADINVKTKKGEGVLERVKDKCEWQTAAFMKRRYAEIAAQNNTEKRELAARRSHDENIRKLDAIMARKRGL